VLLSEVLVPLTEAEFLGQYLSERYCVGRGESGRFARLVKWQDLSEALSRMRFAEDRLQLSQHGKVLDVRQYRQEGFGNSIRVHWRRLERLLADGATLVLNQVDEIFAGVGELAASCEDLFRIRVGVNLYAGWRTDHGFGVHWDAHDTFIVQVAGRKKWKVYEPTLAHPILRKGGEQGAEPSRPPVWEGVLEDGDILYMPRGWWHIATPLDEPTLHLTVGWSHPTAADLLRWLSMTLERYVDCREDIPHLKTSEIQRAYIDNVRERIVEALADNDVIDRFLRTIESSIPTRQGIQLPDLSVSNRGDLDVDGALRLTDGRRLRLAIYAGEELLRVETGERSYTCDRALAPALRLLHGAHPSTLREMLAGVGFAHGPALRAFMTLLIANNVVWAERRPTSEHSRRVAVSIHRAQE
jgi:ribosomal protein L16 Arg81 hydroxylase